MLALLLVVPTDGLGVVLSEDAIGVVLIEPDVTVIVRLAQMRLIRLGDWIIRHAVVGDALEGGPSGVPCRFPGLDEDQVLNGDELERPVLLRLVDQNRGPEKTQCACRSRSHGDSVVW